MAFDPKPSTWLGTGYSSNAAAHSITATTGGVTGGTGTFPLLADADADPTTGDIRKVLFAIMEQLWNTWNTGIPAANEPKRMNINKTASVNTATGEVTARYTLQFTLLPSGFTVEPE